MLFSRGYDEVDKKMSRGSAYTMSCFNCDYFFQAPGDLKEMCQNNDVIKYDMIVTETGIYCLKWHPISNPSKPTIFKIKEKNSR